MLDPRSFLAALLALTSLASAQLTWVVDDQPGPDVDFATIDEALAVAGPFDLVDVRHGVYPAFHMDRPTRLMGAKGGGTRVSQASTIEGIAAGDRAVVADLWVQGLEVRGCSGTVILDGLRVTNSLSAPPQLLVEDCADVRGHALTCRSLNEQFGVSIRSSRVQFDRSTLQGADFSGGQALEVTGGSFVHLSSCLVQAGIGHPGDQWTLPGSGGDAIRCRDASSVRAVRCEIIGGPGGFGFWPGDGPAGWAWHASGGDHEIWDSYVAGTPFNPTPRIRLLDGAILVDDVPLPSLEAIGVPEPGETVGFELRGAPAAAARILFGRFPVRVPIPTSSVDRLVDVGRLASLGAVPASDPISLGFTIPAWPRGTVVHLQASTTDATGDTEMSNSVALVVR